MIHWSKASLFGTIALGKYGIYNYVQKEKAKQVNDAIKI